MLFGVTPREWGDFFEEAYAQTKVAEEYGFNSVWFEEHHEHKEYLPSPLNALSMVSQHTKLKLGTNIVILPLYNPFRLAEEVAQLDCNTHGRVIFGVAAGYREKDFANLGLDLENRGGFMNEGVALVSKLLSEEDVSFEGKYFNVSHATIQPRPFQKPRPPIWIGGWKPPALRRAARMGDAWFPGPTVDLAGVLDCMKTYADELTKLHKPIPKLPIMRDVYVAETTERAIKESEESFNDMYQVDYSASGHPLISGQKHSFEEWAADRFLIGSPDKVIEEVDKIRKKGFNYVVLRASLRKLRSEQIIESVRLFGQKVIPHFREQA